jgi:hypothetical protein
VNGSQGYFVHHAVLSVGQVTGLEGLHRQLQNSLCMLPWWLTSSSGLFPWVFLWSHCLFQAQTGLSDVMGYLVTWLHRVMTVYRMPCVKSPKQQGGSREKVDHLRLPAKRDLKQPCWHFRTCSGSRAQGLWRLSQTPVGVRGQWRLDGERRTA